jgi:hypothetical protein
VSPFPRGVSFNSQQEKHMTKIIYTLIRYLLTAAGASEAVLSDDAVMQAASALVTLGCTVWGLYESRRHAALATNTDGDSGNDSGGTGVVAALLLVFASLPLLGGCAATQSADPALLARKSAKYATAAYLDAHPEDAARLTALQTAMSSILGSADTDAVSLAAAIRAACPDLDPARAALVASILCDARDAYAASLPAGTDLASRAADVAQALSTGLGEGIALHALMTK